MREKMKTTNGITKKELKQVLISDLIPYKTNPRKNDDAVAGVAASLQEFGYIKNSIIIDENNVLLAGHTTLKAMLSLGWDKAPEVTQVFGLSEIKKKAYRIADNKLGEKAEWDAQLLINELESIKIEGLDINITGFNEKELVTFMADLNKGKDPLDAEPQISRAEELRKEWRTELGQLWQCGDHRVICGDCTDPAIVERVMGGKKAALFATDPPYGVAYGDETGADTIKFKKIANDENNGEKLQAFLEDAFRSCLPHLNKNAAWYLWHAQMTQGFFAAAAAAAAAAAGVIIHRQIIWVKPSLIMGHGDYHWKHELCFYGWVEGNRPPWYGDRKQTTVWEIGRENDHVHPTQKPVELFVRPLEFNTLKGDHALDPFLGSGSSLIACENTGRVLHGIEIDPGYVAVCLQRYKDVTGNTPVLVKE